MYTWYFVDPETSANLTPGSAGSDSQAKGTSEAGAGKLKALEDGEAALAQKEKERTGEWNKKMEELKSLQDSSAQLKKSSGGSGCGYKHYKPPRKLERKVIGLVYEK